MMKHLTKLLSLMLVLSLLLSLSPKVFAEEETALVETVPQEAVLEENGFTYTVENGEATVVKCPNLVDIVIPDTLGGYPVTVLGREMLPDCENAFMGDDINITKSVHIPDTVHTISERCFFHCEELSTINLPKDVQHIGASAFEATKLSFDELNLTLDYLGESAFETIPIRKLVLNGTLDAIGDRAFWKCGIEEVSLPQSVKTIGVYAFVGNNIKTLSLPSKVERIMPFAFNSCKIESLTLPDTVQYIWNAAFANNAISQVSLPEGLLVLSDNAFAKNEGLTQLQVPDSVLHFSKPTDSTVEIIGNTGTPAAAYCQFNNLPFRDIETGELLPETHEVTIDGVRYTICQEQALVSGRVVDELPSVIVIPQAVEGKPVTQVLQSALHDTEATLISLPEGITHIGDSAFSHSTELQYVSLPDSLLVIGHGILSNCSEVAAFYAPPGVKLLIPTIFNSSDYNNWYLGLHNSIILGKWDSYIVQSIVNDIYFISKKPYWFIEAEYDRVYYYYGRGIYSTADNESLRLDMIRLDDRAEYTVLPNSINGIPVTEIMPKSITGRTGTYSIYLGENVTTIHEYIFWPDVKPTTFYIPKKTTEISDKAFHGSHATRLVIVAYEDSYAHQFAETHGYPYKLIPKMRFTDVKPESWYYDSVKYVFENGLMKGVSETKFDPRGTMTRAMLAQVFFNLAGDEDFDLAPPFVDVPANAWYAQAVSWAAWCELVNGVTSTEFKPNDPVTREQMVTIFYRFANALQLDTSGRADLSGYEDDQKISGYATDAFSWAVEAGIINGVTDTRLDPKGMSNRAQVATVIARFMQWFSAQ